MKKEKGFTLVELMAAIVILGVLMAVAAGAFGSIKKNNAKKEIEQVAESIKKIGETMYTSSIIREENLFVSGNTVIFTGAQLKEKELIESATIENPFDKGQSCDIKLTITKATATESSKIEACVICNKDDLNDELKNVCK